jgi:hypothetical protein
LLEIERTAEQLASRLYHEAGDHSDPIFHAMRSAADALWRLLDIIVADESDAEAAV